MSFTHLNEKQQAQMVDITNKTPTRRVAVAQGKVFTTTDVATRVTQQKVAKGDVLSVARVAGIQAAKRTSELIPLCHGLTISSASVDFVIHKKVIEITAKVTAVDRTGVEMEALTACSVAALTIYDMCKSLDRSMVIGDIVLQEKTGGRSGAYYSRSHKAQP